MFLFSFGSFGVFFTLFCSDGLFLSFFNWPNLIMKCHFEAKCQKEMFLNHWNEMFWLFPHSNFKLFWLKLLVRFYPNLGIVFDALKKAFFGEISVSWKFSPNAMAECILWGVLRALIPLGPREAKYFCKCAWITKLKFETFFLAQYEGVETEE